MILSRITFALRPVLMALAAGWLVSLVFGLWIARLQFGDVSATFPPDKLMAEYEARLDREIREGPLLLLAQIGVMAGVLTWQITVTAYRVSDPVRQGATAGLFLALIQGIIAVLMHAPWALIVPLVAVLSGVGAYAGWTVAQKGTPEK